MKCWLKIPDFTRKVGVLSKFRNLTDLVTWNPGIINTKLSLDTMGVFQAAVNMEIFRDNHIKVALLSLIELKDESHFAETVAQNRGTNFRTFTDLDTAINWLLNN
jgi:hypothetical protein